MGLASFSGKAGFAIGKALASSKCIALAAPQKVFVLKSGQILTTKEFAKAGALGKHLLYAKPVTLPAGTKLAVLNGATFLVPSAKAVAITALKLPLILVVKGGLALGILGSLAAAAAAAWSGDDYPGAEDVDNFLHKEEQELDKIHWR
jgi:hypothetical protein